ncbi:MAG: DUF2845 domain-containing protein [Desulfobacteraceae bacterium]|jgi:hypothetical protein
MNKIKSLGMLVLFILLTVSTATALQYGNELISEGDLKGRVLMICGEPLSRDVIGYIDHVESEKRIRVMVIEEWVIEVKNYNTIYLYSLVFEGNELKEIRSIGKKK